jgi:hypothetical protein
VSNVLVIVIDHTCRDEAQSNESIVEKPAGRRVFSRGRRLSIEPTMMSVVKLRLPGMDGNYSPGFLFVLCGVAHFPSPKPCPGSR